MTNKSRILQELWDQVPPVAQAASVEVVRALDQRVAALEARLGQI